MPITDPNEFQVKFIDLNQRIQEHLQRSENTQANDVLQGLRSVVNQVDAQWRQSQSSKLQVLRQEGIELIHRQQAALNISPANIQDHIASFDLAVSDAMQEPDQKGPAHAKLTTERSKLVDLIRTIKWRYSRSLAYFETPMRDVDKLSESEIKHLKELVTGLKKFIQKSEARLHPEQALEASQPQTVPHSARTHASSPANLLCVETSVDVNTTIDAPPPTPRGRFAPMDFEPNPQLMSRHDLATSSAQTSPISSPKSPASEMAIG